MINLSWVDKLEAISALCPGTGPSLKMRPDRTWYVAAVPVEIGGDGVLTSPTQQASKPERAVNQWWEQYVLDLPAGQYLTTAAGTDQVRRRFRWSGFGWFDVDPS